MLNPLVTLISGQVSSPFSGGEKRKTVTRKHYPLVWECMLGTVYARDPVTGKVLYCDYDYSKAHAHARVTECSDLRTSRNPGGFSERSQLRLKQWALWGIPPATK